MIPGEQRWSFAWHHPTEDISTSTTCSRVGDGWLISKTIRNERNCHVAMIYLQYSEEPATVFRGPNEILYEGEKPE